MASQATARAIVAHEPDKGILNLNLEEVTLRELGPDEVLVRMVATGVCHTDIVFALAPAEAGGPFPKVLGHEGEAPLPISLSKASIENNIRCWIRGATWVQC